MITAGRKAPNYAKPSGGVRRQLRGLIQAFCLVPEPRLPYVYAGHVDDQMYNAL